MSQQQFIIEGGHKLSGEVKVSGSKNAALPILCATLLTKEKSTLHNVPDISDIHALLKIFSALGVKHTFKDHTLEIDPSDLNQDAILQADLIKDNCIDITAANGPSLPKLIETMRASILLVGPLLARFKAAKIPFPGGCVLGKRSVHSHTYAFQKLGAEIINETSYLHLTLENPKANNFIMPEMSVTATENALMLAASIPGKSEIRLAAAEPHVQDLCHLLNKMGAKITGIGTHFLTVEGTENLKGAEHSVTGDYLEAGTYAIAALLTKGDLKITGIETAQLDAVWQKLEEMGAKFTLTPTEIHLKPTEKFTAPSPLRTAVYPSFPTDLQAPFSVLLTQAEGQSQVFETLFEGRLNYLFELEKMGAKIQMQNPHQALITGPTTLHGVPIASIDIRAGAAMVLAALAAHGKTEISNIKYIDRGYEKLEDKLRSLGAKISRV